MKIPLMIFTAGLLFSSGVFARNNVVPPLDLGLPTGDAVRSEAPYVREVALPFYQKYLVEAFDPAGINPDAVNDVVAIRKALALAFATGNSTYLTATLRQKGKNRLKSGDPAAALAFGSDKPSGKNEKSKALENALKNLGDSPADRLMAVLLTAQRLRIDPRPPTEKDYCAAVAAAFSKDAPFGNADPRLILRLLKEVKNDKRLHPPALFDIPFASPWPQMVLRGENFSREAFVARGGGFAGSVTEDGWRGFDEKENAAYELLEGAYRLHPDWPDAAAELVGIAPHVRKKSHTYWLKKTLAASFDSPRATHLYAHYSMARWCGSPELFLAQAKAYMQAKRYDTLLPFQGLEALLTKFHRNELGMDLIAERYLRDNRPLMEQMYATIDGYIAASDEERLVAGSRDYFRRAGIVVAILDNDWDRVMAYVNALEDRNATKQDWPFLSTMGARRYGHTFGPFAYLLPVCRVLDEIVRAEKLALAGQHAEAEVIFETIATRKGTHETVRRYCDSRRMEARVYAGMQNGEWFSLMPTATRYDILSYWSHPKVEKGIIIPGNKTRSALCFSVSLPRDNISFAGTLHFLPDPKQKKWEVSWSFSSVYDVASYSPRFCFERENGVDTLTVFNSKSIAFKTELEGTPATRSFLCTAKDGRFLFEVDGKVIIDEPSKAFLSKISTNRLTGDDYIHPVVEVKTNTGFSDYRCRIFPGFEKDYPWSALFSKESPFKDASR